MGQQADVRSAGHHPLRQPYLCGHQSGAATFCPDPSVARQALGQLRQPPLTHRRCEPHTRGVYEQAHLHHHVYHRGDICHCAGDYPHDGRPKLYHHGLRPAGRVCVAAGGYPHLVAHPSQQDRNQERIPYLCAIDDDRFHHHQLPHHPDTEYSYQPYSPTYPTDMLDMAMEYHQTATQARSQVGCYLYLPLVCCVYCLTLLFMDGLHTVERRTVDMVDYAVDVHPHHHLLQRIAPCLCQS